MKIAVTSSGKTLDDQVTKEFEKAAYLLIIETDNLSLSVFEGHGDGLELAGQIKEYDCEGVITGEIEEDSFYALADEGITRFKGDGMAVGEALDKMEKRQLEYLRDYKGAPPGHHHH
ncbi:NifB/NifX family molybdenum-iron cluster-binding protein [Eubacteriaceae bacterium ES3]|nr:NifB/NifX family molybdenum-iron cluster-binding protein [Eubacteriaceae bacterium ES3]